MVKFDFGHEFEVIVKWERSIQVARDVTLKVKTTKSIKGAECSNLLKVHSL